LIDESKHIVLETSHPSPFSANRWFLGCWHFLKVNEILKERWEKEIDWKV
jgi:uracil-DNA glycosylase